MIGGEVQITRVVIGSLCFRKGRQEVMHRVSERFTVYSLFCAFFTPLKHMVNACDSLTLPLRQVVLCLMRTGEKRYKNQQVREIATLLLIRKGLKAP